MCLEGTIENSLAISSRSSKVSVCKSLTCPWTFVGMSVHCWEVVRFYFSRAAENSIWIALFTKLNENPEPLKIKIDVLGNHKGNVTYSPSFQLLLSLSGGNRHGHSKFYKLGRTLCPFGIAIAQISVWGERKEALHSTKESSSWISRSQSLYVNVLPAESSCPT